MVVVVVENLFAWGAMTTSGTSTMMTVTTTEQKRTSILEEVDREVDRRPRVTIDWQWTACCFTVCIQYKKALLLECV